MGTRTLTVFYSASVAVYNLSFAGGVVRGHTNQGGGENAWK